MTVSRAAGLFIGGVAHVVLTVLRAVLLILRVAVLGILFGLAHVDTSSYECHDCGDRKLITYHYLSRKEAIYYENE